MAIKTRLEDLTIGDTISCRYTATTGVAGVFSELGTCIASEIPVTGTPTPDGLFYFRKNDKGMLIADRVIQTNISWDVLNNAKMIQGVAIYNNYKPLSLPQNQGWSRDSGGVIENEEIIGNALHLKTNDATDYVYYQLSNIVNPNAITVVECKAKIMSCGGSQNSPAGILIDDGGKMVQAKFLTNKITTHDGQEYAVDMTNYHVVRLTRNGQTGWKLDIDGINVLNGTTGISVTTNRICFGNWNMTDWADSYWEYIKLNNLGVFDDNIKDLKIRSLTGGNAYLGTDGKASLTDKGLGAFPANNEWDKYIVKSDLNGTITEGDDNVWHWNAGIASHCVDTTNLGLYASTGRVTRGAVNYAGTWYGKDDAKYLNYGISSGAGNHIGFRPVLECLDFNSKATTLWH